MTKPNNIHQSRHHHNQPTPSTTADDFDPRTLNPWSKQSCLPRAKQGQASDITMGDESVFTGRRQFTTTMKLHFPDHNTTSSKELAEIEATIPAGRSLGVPAGSREIHVVLGDGNKVQPERLKSVTSETYIPHKDVERPLSTVAAAAALIVSQQPGRNLPEGLLSAVVPIAAGVSTKKGTNNANIITGDLSTSTRPTDEQYQLRWRPKKELIMGSAHFGTQTRDDLPSDHRHFHNFETTNDRTYGSEELKIAKDLQVKMGVERFDKKPRGRTSIPQGDREKTNIYETEASK
ncbi:hypothetical protein HDU76_002224, partial [Blyttiomyces sp. JEL0837]